MRPSEIPTALQDAILLAQSGQRTEARRLLEQIVEIDPRQEAAWVWLATVSTSREDRVAYLERALALNPANTTAQTAYQQLTGHGFAPSAVTVAAQPAARDRNRNLLRAGAIVITMLVLLMIAAFVLASQLVGDDNTGSRPIPTLRPVEDQPADAEQPVFATITLTPLPTRTPGPSPTSIWAAPPPTWTAPPAGSPMPGRTPRPSFTPWPTSEAFLGPWALSATAAYVQTSDAGPATMEYVLTQAAITPTRTP